MNPVTQNGSQNEWTTPVRRRRFPRSSHPSRPIVSSTPLPFNFRYRYSAGILPYSKHEGTTYILLGKDKRERKWSDWGGKADPDDEGKHQLTAAREFFEETVGSVCSYDEMLVHLREKTTGVVQSETLNGHLYILFLVKIPYENYTTLFGHTLSFLQYIQCDKKYLEKTEMAWVPLPMFLQSISQYETPFPLRPFFERTIQKNVHALLDHVEKEI